MSYLKDVGETSALYLPPGEVEHVTMRSGTVARFVATGSVTQGRFGLFEWNMLPGMGGSSPHFHKTFSESFYILSGTVRLYDGARWVDATPGDFLHVPEGGVHNFANESDEAAAMLILFAPGAPREAYFRELAEIGQTGRTLTEDEWTELYARHDQYRAT
ncbi:cupin domain-containing protein [Sphaerisporangium perillae]|uniref:cupin domain-containing protein n=1 Tax=Sphaerisporangium perillae TaxID=2935860 RepID=UPI00200EC7B5|nr:cupin domain-containing protein [Sphaerisporangium perillae]